MEDLTPQVVPDRELRAESVETAAEPAFDSKILAYNEFNIWIPTIWEILSKKYIQNQKKKKGKKSRNIIQTALLHSQTMTFT